MPNPSYLSIAIKWTFFAVVWLAVAGGMYLWRGSSCRVAAYVTVAAVSIGYGIAEMLVLWHARRKGPS